MATEGSTRQAQLTLTAAVLGSLFLLGLVVLWTRQASSSGALVSLPSPWEPPAVSPAVVPIPVVTLPATSRSPSPSPSPTPPPSSSRPTSVPAPRPASPPPPTTRPAPEPPNLSLVVAGADADGSTKATGSRFNNVRDGDLTTFWSPIGVTGEISEKWPVPQTVGRITVREAPGGGTIRAWQVRDHDADRILASGNGAGVITFTPVTLRKITFVVLSATGTPRVAEYETFAR